MLQSEEANFQNKMGRLRANYLLHLSERVKELEVFIQNSREGSVSNRDKEMLSTSLHQLSGSAGTYGFKNVSDEARALEQKLLGDGVLEHSELEKNIRALCAACKAATVEQETALSPSEGDIDPSKQLPVLLVVDDDPLLRVAFREALADCATIITGESSADALRLMREHKPDLVLLDDIMPGGITGLGFLEERRNHSDIANIPIVMVTASNKEQDVLRGLKAGAVEYLIKPVELGRLISIVREILERKPNDILLLIDDKRLEGALAHRLIQLSCEVYTSEDLWTKKSAQGQPTIIVMARADGLGVDPMEIQKRYPNSSCLVFGPAQRGGLTETALFECVDYTDDEAEILRRIGLILRRIKGGSK